MKYRRGFKTDTNWYAREMRRELDIPPYGALCPWKLAAHLGFNIVKLSDYASNEPKAVSYFRSDKGQREFSAVTLCGQDIPWIVHNDFHHPRRQAANIAHEAAHGLLCHPPAPLTGANGARMFNREHEDEANWLGPALLISEEAALHIVEHRLPNAEACQLYGVSSELLQMRLRVTGALIRIARRKAA